MCAWWYTIKAISHSNGWCNVRTKDTDDHSTNKSRIDSNWCKHCICDSCQLKTECPKSVTPASKAIALGSVYGCACVLYEDVFLLCDVLLGYFGCCCCCYCCKICRVISINRYTVASKFDDDHGNGAGGRVKHTPCNTTKLQKSHSLSIYVYMCVKK